MSQTAIALVTYTQSAIGIAGHSVAQCFTYSRDITLTLTALSQQIAHDTCTQHVLTMLGETHSVTPSHLQQQGCIMPLHAPAHTHTLVHAIAYTLIHIHAQAHQ